MFSECKFWSAALKLLRIVYVVLLLLAKKILLLLYLEKRKLNNQMFDSNLCKSDDDLRAIFSFYLYSH